MCSVALTIDRNVICFSKRAQKRQVGTKLYSSKEMTSDKKSNPQEKLRRIRNDK